ncbi:MAG: hypothetical protein KDA53_08235 [Hyphomonas sp.]|nr:hypothetical protein [Hyphomonas sp.]
MRFRPAQASLLLLLTAACATPPPEPAGVAFSIAADPGDVGAATAEADVAAARQKIETFFDAPFPEPVRITIAPDRAAFDAAMPAEWGMISTECWMVGVGVADWLAVLSPAAWSAEACEHDGSDRTEVQGIITHELVHTYHGQHNPTRDFTGMDAAGWFVEGLATYVSGQLETSHAGDAAEAIAEGAAPTELESAWSGRYRYGVSGSMVAYIDETYGRGVLVALLPATSEEEILSALGSSEAEFIASWAEWAGD